MKLTEFRKVYFTGKLPDIRSLKKSSGAFKSESGMWMIDLDVYEAHVEQAISVNKVTSNIRHENVMRLL